MDRNNIEKIAKNPEDRVLLAKVWDKINTGIRKNIPANTCFLSLREQEMTKYLFGQMEGLHTLAGTRMRNDKCWCIYRITWMNMRFMTRMPPWSVYGPPFTKEMPPPIGIFWGH